MVSTDTLNYILALGTVAMQVSTIALFAMYFLGKRTYVSTLMSSHLEKWGMWIFFVLTFAGSLLTLYYSEILGYPPCPLCWWQRVFLYPQVALFGLALWRKERAIIDYSILLSVCGLTVALYHHALQILPSGSLPCPAEGVVSCGQRFVFEFGYITFPLMAASLFAFLIALALHLRVSR